mgnify:CR=1 FL=1
MLKRLFGSAPIEVWVIKQIDPDVLHLCGLGHLQYHGKRKHILADLARGQFQGGVRLVGGGLVLNARLFEALVPRQALTLADDDHAHWQGRTWRVSRVPQRCWDFEGRLVAQPLGNAGSPSLVSSEDVSNIRGRVDRQAPQPPGTLTFRAENELETPRRDPHDTARRPARDEPPPDE